MALIIGQDIEVRVAVNDDPNDVVTDDSATLIAVGHGIKVHLPGSEYPSSSEERHHFLHGLKAQRILTVRVLEYDDVLNLWVVSRQAVLLGNPWRDEVLCWTPGATIKRLRVTNVHGDQVYGEILPGVEGRTSLREIRTYLGKQDEAMNIVLGGDSLVGYIGEPDRENRIVPLDIVKYLKYLDTSSQAPEIEISTTQTYANSDTNHVPSPALHTVLVVDDNPQYLQAIRRRLEAIGLAVLPAGSSQQALRLIDMSGGSEPDIAIIDINLNPAGDSIEGLRLAKILRERWPGIKLLLTSGDTNTRALLIGGDSLGLTVHGFLAKPFASPRLRAELAKVALALQQFPSCPKDPIRPMPEGSPGASFSSQKSCLPPPSMREAKRGALPCNVGLLFG